MSTIADRVRLAFNAATGENKAPSDSWIAANTAHLLEVRNILGSRRHEARGHDDVAVQFARDAFEVALERVEGA